MDAPKCKICGGRHYGPCISRSAPKLKAETPGPAPLPDPVPVAEAAPVKVKKTRAPNGTFDRTAYQREYMRKRREMQKLKSLPPAP